MKQPAPRSHTVLLEVGVEELPAQMVVMAVEQFARLLPQYLQEARVTYASVHPFGTPRRIGAVVEGVALQQAAATQEMVGPPAQIALDADGQLTAAGRGFVTRHGATRHALRVQETAKGPYVVLTKRLPTRPVGQVLRAIVPAVLGALQFPKTMRWHQGRAAFGVRRASTVSPNAEPRTTNELTFPRPIRWLVVLCGRQVIPVRLGAVTAGRVTRSHRGRGARAITIPAASQYRALMRREGIVLDPAQRREAVRKALRAKLRPAERVAEELEERSSGWSLVDEVSHLVECPWAFRGSVDQKFGRLPAPILLASMAKYQRVFAITNRQNRLTLHFIAVVNGQPRQLRLVRQVFERILAARLTDSVLCYAEDQKTPLRDRVTRLAGVQMHRALGTMYDKSQRLKALAAHIADAWALPSHACAQAAEAAELCKADLVSRVVYEFPSLQGIMGGIYYAERHGGNQRVVAEAIQDHYLSQTAVPRHVVGSVVAIADRLDTLVGFLGSDLRPSGSADPFGVRRAANELLALLMHESARHLKIDALVQTAVHLWGGAIAARAEDVRRSVCEYLQERFETRQEARYDLVRAVLAAGFDDVGETVTRIRALEQCVTRHPALFAQACKVAERTRNIVKAAQEQATQGVQPDPAHFSDPLEHEVWSALTTVRPRIKTAIQQRDYVTALRAYAETFSALLDTFFDRVMVHVDDAVVRQNRLALLQQIDQLVSHSVADLTHITA